MPTSEAARSRLSRDARREQLLDAAAGLMVEQGAGAVTMERVAEYAGVSKALPYSHFDNSNDVLVALYHRVVGELGSRILEALHGAADDADLVELLVTTFLDTVVDIGPVLGAVTAPGSPAAVLADADQRIGPTFVAGIMVEHFDVPRRRAEAAAPVALSALVGAVAAWGDGVASRRQAQEMSVAVLRALIG